MPSRVQNGPPHSPLVSVEKQLSRIRRMDVAELAQLWRQLYGEPTRTRNKDDLQKKLSFRVQELAEGGLSPRARARVSELAEAEAENETQRRTSRKQSAAYKLDGHERPVKRKDDDRIPRVGTVIKREYEGRIHAVKVRENDFEYEGGSYPSLSRIAGQITGRTWNGFVFFGLLRRRSNRGEK